MDTVIHLRTARVGGTYSHTGMMPNKSSCTNYTAEITQRRYTVNLSGIDNREDVRGRSEERGPSFSHAYLCSESLMPRLCPP